MDNTPITPVEWATAQSKELIAQNTPNVYIAVVEDEAYRLEIEIDCVNVFSVWHDETDSFDLVLNHLDLIKETLRREGIRVFDDPEAWEEFAETL